MANSQLGYKITGIIRLYLANGDLGKSARSKLLDGFEVVVDNIFV